MPPAVTERLNMRDSASKRGPIKLYVLMLTTLLVYPGMLLAQDVPQISYIGTFAKIEGKPARIDIDDNMEIVFISDPSTKRVLKYRFTGSPSGYIDRFMIKPLSVSSLIEGRILEGDLGDGSLRLYSTSGEFISNLNREGPVEHPGGAAFYKDLGLLYVSDSKNHRILIFDMLRDGMPFGEFGGYGQDPGKLDFPTDIVVDPYAGEILVCDVGNGRVQIFDYLGNFRASVGKKGGGYEKPVANDELIRPQGVAVDRKGRIYIADTFLSEVKVFDRYGEFLTKIGGYGNDAGQFNLPTDVAIDKYNRLFVLNQGSSRIELFGIDNYSQPPSTPSGGGGGCFISVVSSGSPLDQGLQTVRKFRDEVLRRSFFGESLISLYYWISPYLVHLVKGREGFREILRPLIEFVIWTSSFGLMHPNLFRFFIAFTVAGICSSIITLFAKRMHFRNLVKPLHIFSMIALIASLLYIVDIASALDAPHNLTNNYDCGSCHILHNSLGSPLINADAVNNLCKSCHISTGPGTDVETHSGNRFSFVTKCTDCHSPHGQNQKKNTGAALASGTSTGLTQDTLTDSTKSWSTNQWVGYTLIPNTSNPYAFKIISNTSTSVTVKISTTATGIPGNPAKLTDVASPGNTYKIIYGRLVGYNYGPEEPQVKSYANSNWYTILFFNKTGLNSFADGDANYMQDICVVCHSQTNHHQYDGTAPGGQSHNDQTQCTATCHSHKQKFWAVGGDCIDCHATTQGALPRRAVVGSGGDFIKRSRHVTNGTTTQVVTKYECSVCHAEGDHLTGNTTSYHADGIIQVKNADTGQVIQIETSARSRNYDQTLVDQFCISCHDSDGATTTYSRNPSPIRVTPTSTNPFGDGGTNTYGTGIIQAYDEGDSTPIRSTGSGPVRYYPRPRVIDVKGQFQRSSSPWDPSVDPAKYADHALSIYGKRYGTQTIKSGAWVSPWNDTSTTHCSDCHFNDTNAHGANNLPYMLDKATASTSDTTWSGESDYVCFKCHNYQSYTSTDTGYVPNAESVEHPIADKTAHGGIENLTRFGIDCLNCHGGREGGPDSSAEISQGRGFGGIHGTDFTITEDGNKQYTHIPYRFTNGSALDEDIPWPDPLTSPTQSSFNCSTRGTKDYFNINCTQHDSSDAKTNNRLYTRPVQY